MSLGDCWFCGEPSRSGDHVRTGLRRDAEESLLGMRRERKATWIDVPRCRRCRIGHEVDRAISYVLIGSAAITGLALLAWGASRLSGDAWAGEWQLLLPVIWTLLWLLLWRGVREHRFNSNRLAPIPRRNAREHPAVLQLVEQGWDNHEGGFQRSGSNEGRPCGQVLPSRDGDGGADG